MIPGTFPKAEVYEGTVQWRQHYRTIPCSTSFDKQLLTLPDSEIYFPNFHRDILIKGDLSIGEHCFSESIIIVEGSVRCYRKAFISQLKTKRSFTAPQGDVCLNFLEAHTNIDLGLRCRIGIAKSNGDVTVGRHSVVEVVIGNNVTIHKDATVNRIYANGIVQIPMGFPEENILDSKGIQYL